MKWVKSSLMLLSAALMSGGCGQKASDNVDNALTLTKTKMNNGNEARAVATSCPEYAGDSAELLRLKQQLQQTQQQLAESNAALIAARGQFNNMPAETLKPVSLAEQKQVRLERRLSAATNRHVKRLERRLTEQDLQLSALHKSLLQTEDDCREIADELERKTTPS